MGMQQNNNTPHSPEEQEEETQQVDMQTTLPSLSKLLILEPSPVQPMTPSCFQIFKRNFFQEMTAASMNMPSPSNSMDHVKSLKDVNHSFEHVMMSSAAVLMPPKKKWEMMHFSQQLRNAASSSSSSSSENNSAISTVTNEQQQPVQSTTVVVQPTKTEQISITLKDVPNSNKKKSTSRSTPSRSTK